MASPILSYQNNITIERDKNRRGISHDDRMGWYWLDLTWEMIFWSKLSKESTGLWSTGDMGITWNITTSCNLMWRKSIWNQNLKTNNIYVCLCIINGAFNWLSFAILHLSEKWQWRRVQRYVPKQDGQHNDISPFSPTPNGALNDYFPPKRCYHLQMTNICYCLNGAVEIYREFVHQKWWIFP